MASGSHATGGHAIAREDTAPIFGRDPPVAKVYGRGRLTLGMLVFDLQRVIGYGASLIAAGTSDLALHAMRHQAAQGRTCIVATPAVTSGTPRPTTLGSARRCSKPCGCGPACGSGPA